MATYRNLDKAPRIFFLPGDQIFPWIIISAVSYFSPGGGCTISLED